MTRRSIVGSLMQSVAYLSRFSATISSSNGLSLFHNDRTPCCWMPAPTCWTGSLCASTASQLSPFVSKCRPCVFSTCRGCVTASTTSSVVVVFFLHPFLSRSLTLHTIRGEIEQHRALLDSHRQRYERCVAECRQYESALQRAERQFNPIDSKFSEFLEMLRPCVSNLQQQVPRLQDIYHRLKEPLLQLHKNTSRSDMHAPLHRASKVCAVLLSLSLPLSPSLRVGISGHV